MKSVTELCCTWECKRCTEPSWFSCPGLEEALAKLPQNPVWKGKPADALKMRAEQLMKTEVGFIDNPRFREPSAGASLFAERLSLQSEDSSRQRVAWDNAYALPGLCAAALLNPQQELLLFERMNFLLHTACQCRAAMNPDHVSHVQLERIELLHSLAHWHRDRIIEANLRLVFAVVKSLAAAPMLIDDLLGDGMLALIRAVEKFDCARGFRFSSYATHVIRRNTYRLIVQRKLERSVFTHDMDASQWVVAKSNHGTSQWQQKRHQLNGAMSTMLESLTRREQLIIRARYSLGPHSKVQTLQAIADRLGVSKERVRQIEKRALEKLQSMAAR